MRLLAFLLSIAISTIRLNRNLSLLLTAGVGICLLLVDFVCFRLLGFGDRKWGTKRAFSLFFSLLFGFLLVQCHLAMRADESFARFW